MHVRPVSACSPSRRVDFKLKARERARLRRSSPARRTPGENASGPDGQGPPPAPAGDLERPRGGCRRPVPARPRRERRLGRVVPRRTPGCVTDARGPAEQFELQFFERQLRRVRERRRDTAPCFRSSSPFARELDEHAGSGLPRRCTARPASRTGSCPLPRSARVRQIHRAFQFVGQQRRPDVHGPDLRRFRAGRRPQRVNSLHPPSSAFVAFEADLRLGARLQPVRRRGFSCTPSGSVTVVSRTSASAQPFGFASSVGLCGTCTSRSDPSGCARTCGAALRASLRSTGRTAAARSLRCPAVRPAAVSHAYWRREEATGCRPRFRFHGGRHRFARGIAAHEVGSVRNGCLGRFARSGARLCRPALRRRRRRRIPNRGSGRGADHRARPRASPG